MFSLKGILLNFLEDYYLDLISDNDILISYLFLREAKASYINENIITNDDNLYKAIVTNEEIHT